MEFTTSCELHSLVLWGHSFAAHWPAHWIKLSVASLILEKTPHYGATANHSSPSLSDLPYFTLKIKKISSWTGNVNCL